MIEKNLLHFNYIKKEPQTGSYKGMRYLFTKGKNDDGDCLNVTIWPEPLCFVKTPEDQKQLKQFPFSSAGCDEAVDWLNEQYEAQIDKWKQ